MKLQDSLFSIRKISYPNSNTRHGKCKINLIAQQGEEGAAAMNTAIAEAFLLQMTKECAQNMLNACAGNFKGQVNEDRAKAHGQEQGRFHFLSNSKVNEQTTDDPHHDTTRCDV